jgi:hypothetical protein
MQNLKIGVVRANMAAVFYVLVHSFLLHSHGELMAPASPIHFDGIVTSWSFLLFFFCTHARWILVCGLSPLKIHLSPWLGVSR